MNFKKGNRVEYSDGNSFWRGTVAKVVKGKVFVDLDSKYGGEIETIESYGLNYLSFSDVESEEQADNLEKEFAALVKSKSQEIKNKFTQANKLIQEAIAMSEESGIPVESKIIGKYGYVPKSYKSKFVNMDPEIVRSLTGLDVNYYEGGVLCGWVSSSSYC